MSFTPKELARIAVPNGFEARVWFEHDTDPRLSFQQCFVCVDDADLQAKSDARAKQAPLFVVAPGTVIQPPPVKQPPPPPPKLAQDQQAWFAALAKVELLQRCVAAKSDKVSAQDLQNAVDAFNALAFDPSFLV